MNTTLTEAQVNKHVELAAKRFLFSSVTKCNFYYTDMFDFKFQPTNIPTPGEKTPWEDFLLYLRIIGVKGFSYSIYHGELYFIAPVITAVPSHQINSISVTLIRHLFNEPYICSFAANHYDIPEQQRLFYKEFYPQKYSSATCFAHDLGAKFDTLTYYEALKAASLYQDLGITTIYYTA
ncbi:hypothetical protein MOC16_gp035 [Klebsiella phage vB_KpM_FBKp24]|uniref:Uncharacterized protein n=1 Tax=Klebsiella phage vB_KpM_FBKp24 TaxID=2801834 RepID=A0A7U0GBK1_9CAUD|nr:hypothetical protein MOC16_gp035 [Klebsiella phage vB_KpM_FBKp24]QQV92165.1 hypothetical protein vBKpMFBKp24_035 [Klebsiella phage vB_KpM_FBKp24]